MDDDEKQKRLAAMMDNAKYVLFNPLYNSQKWPRQSFSLQYQYSIKHISDENKKDINQVIISWTDTKFSKLKS